MSLSYWLVALGSAWLVYAVCHALDDRLHWQPALLLAWGRNPLLLYVAHYWLWIAFLFFPGGAGWAADAPVWLPIAEGAVYLAALSGMAWWLDRRGWWVSV